MQTFLHFKKADNWSVPPFQTHIISFLGLFFSYTSSSSMHMCISVELFMLCFVFNTPSCKSRTARHKAVKTALPSNPSQRGCRIYGQVLTPETGAERSLPGPSLKLSTFLLDAPSHFVSFWTCLTPRGDSAVWHPFLSTCSVTWSSSQTFHLYPEAPCRAYTWKFVSQIKGGVHCWGLNIIPVSCKLLEQNSCR